jgi:hypothetical protein
MEASFKIELTAQLHETNHASTRVPLTKCHTGRIIVSGLGLRVSPLNCRTVGGLGLMSFRYSYQLRRLLHLMVLHRFSDLYGYMHPSKLTRRKLCGTVRGRAVARLLPSVELPVQGA